MRKETIPSFAEADAVNNPMKDYQKLILGMEYALEGERNKCEELSAKNRSLESEISNLRNLLMGPDEHKHVLLFRLSTRRRPSKSRRTKSTTWRPG